MLAVLALLLAAPVASTPTPTPVVWDALAHRVIAARAYDQLQPATRAAVDALVRRHPDLDSLAVGVDPATPAGVRELFLRLSVWPDELRGDARFHADNAPPTPLLPGFPDMARHASWHYVDRAFSNDAAAALPPTGPSTAAAMAASVRTLADPAAEAPHRAYHLGWLVHVVGDLHQPMHGTSRASVAQPRGDAGGNRVRVRTTAVDSVNLHAFWDGAFRESVGTRETDVAAATVAARYPVTTSVLAGTAPVAVTAAATLLQGWADESATLAEHVAYAVEERAGDAPPPLLDEAYRTTAARVAASRVAQAAQRLAALLEALLGR